jgi:hypothetical protein
MVSSGALWLEALRVAAQAHSETSTGPCLTCICVLGLGASAQSGDFLRYHPLEVGAGPLAVVAASHDIFTVMTCHYRGLRLLVQRMHCREVTACASPAGRSGWQENSARHAAY